MTEEKKATSETKAAQPKDKKLKKGKSQTKSRKPKPAAEYDKSKVYPIEEAIKMTKQFSKTKFDASVEIHFRLGIDPKKGDQQVRAAISLPHGTGKTIRVAAFVSSDKEKECKAAGADIVGSDDLIAEIKKTEKTDFQVAVAEPAMMKNLAQIAKILGTRGLMPSPKNETVTPNPAKAIEELKKGKVSFKNDDTSNIHVAIGKVSFDEIKLKENFEKILGAIRKAKPASSKGVYLKNISITSSMGPGIKVQIPK
jgi:large subunit ribosomal protein L1